MQLWRVTMAENAPDLVRKIFHCRSWQKIGVFSFHVQWMLFVFLSGHNKSTAPAQGLFSEREISI